MGKFSRGNIREMGLSLSQVDGTGSRLVLVFRTKWTARRHGYLDLVLNEKRVQPCEACIRSRHGSSTSQLQPDSGSFRQEQHSLSDLVNEGLLPPCHLPLLLLAHLGCIPVVSSGVLVRCGASTARRYAPTFGVFGCTTVRCRSRSGLFGLDFCAEFRLPCPVADSLRRALDSNRLAYALLSWEQTHAA